MSTVGQSARVDKNSFCQQLQSTKGGLNDTGDEINLEKQNRCNLYYLVLEIVIGELKRFTGESLEVATANDEFLCLNAKGAESFINKFSVPGLNNTMLFAEMGILKCIIEADGNNPSKMPLKDLVQILKEHVCTSDVNVYSNYKILFTICLTLPSNSATCERTFSTMRRINNWLRSTMSQDRLSNLIVLHSESDIVKNLDVEDGPI